MACEWAARGIFGFKRRRLGRIFDTKIVFTTVPGVLLEGLAINSPLSSALLEAAVSNGK